MDILIVDESDVTAELDRRFRETLRECFPGAEVFHRTRAYHGSAPAYSVYIEAEDGRISAHAGVVDRRMTVGARSLRIAGVQNVAVPKAFRTGLGFLRVMKASMKEAGRRGFDMGLLFCAERLVRLYGAVGWKTFDNQPIVRVEEGAEKPVPAGHFGMYYPLLVSEFPPGPVHLGGNDW